MARDDDDDDDDRPRKKGRRDDEDSFEDDDTPPKKGKARDDDEVPRSAEKKLLPARLIAAAVASMAWGFLNLHASCVSTTNGFSSIIESHLRRNPFGDDMPIFIQGPSRGMGWTLAIVQLLFFVFSVVLFASGSLMLLRKGFAKFMAMGAPILLVLVGLIGLVICLILTKGSYISFIFNGLLLNCLFSLVVGIFNFVMLLNKDVSKALK